MSGQMKVRSLSLSRKTQTPPNKEESPTLMIRNEEKACIANLETILSSPIAHSSRICSTPISKNGQFENFEESPDQNYCGSPTSLYPCTQESGSEIAWDWNSNSKQDNHSPTLDRKNKHNSMLNNTPKRPQFLRKKRIAKANSPLLNIPHKRKLNQLNVAESIGRFAEELRALADKIKTDQNSADNVVSKVASKPVDNGAESSKELNIFNMQTQVIAPEPNIHDLTTLEFSYEPKKPLKAKDDSNKLDSSLDDLFDDAIEACMVQCSQEVENKIKLETELQGNANVTYTNVTNGDKNVGYNSRISDKNAVSVRFEQPMPKRKTEVNSSRVFSNCNQSASSAEDQPSQIPDDSLDDCLALCLDDDQDLLSKAMGDRNPGNETHPTKLSKGSSSLVANIPISDFDKLRSTPISNMIHQSSDTTSNFKRKQPCTSTNNSSNSSCATGDQNRKFFKTKSVSDSFYGHSSPGHSKALNTGSSTKSGISKQCPIWKSNSSYSLNAKTRSNSGFAIPNTSNPTLAAGSRNNSSCYTAPNEQQSNNRVTYSYLRDNNVKTLYSESVVSNCNHYAGPSAASKKSLMEQQNSMSSYSRQLKCTPQEIERKRIEAKMRLEANKLKKQLDLNKPQGPISQSITRLAVVKR